MLNWLINKLFVFPLCEGYLFEFRIRRSEGRWRPATCGDVPVYFTFPLLGLEKCTPPR
jgi:hypothetical protein